MLKEINIRFIGVGYNNNYQADIIIYDKYNNIVTKGKTYNGLFKCFLKVNCLYKMEVIFLGNKNIYNLYIINNLDTYYYTFSNAYINSNLKLVTFILTDYNYNNLPLERGIINLWQKL